MAFMTARIENMNIEDHHLAVNKTEGGVPALVHVDGPSLSGNFFSLVWNE